MLLFLRKITTHDEQLRDKIMVPKFKLFGMFHRLTKKLRYLPFKLGRDFDIIIGNRDRVKFGINKLG